MENSIRNAVIFGVLVIIYNELQLQSVNILISYLEHN